MNIKEIFSQIRDPRIERGKLHLLDDIFGLSLLAVICGAESWESIEVFGKSKEDFLKQILELPNGIPSHDTIERVFRSVNSKEFEGAFLKWIATLSINTEGKIVSIDGKTLRGSQDENNGKYAIHMVSAWCDANSITLGQIKTESKTNEIQAIKDLLNVLSIQGAIVTIDAMGCQKEIAAQIVELKADYILAVKENQKNLLQEMQDLFKYQGAEEYFTKTEGDHGRIETRKCSIITKLNELDKKEDWKKLSTIIKIESQRQIKDKTTNQIRYYISSCIKTAEYFNTAIRTHWSIENKCHWVLDVQMNEDHSRKRKDHAAENFAIIRRIALNLLKIKPYRRFGIQNKRLVASWDHKFLLSLTC